jgi:hypothetical protein
MRHAAWTAVLVVSLAYSGKVNAQDATAKTTAEALFAEGRRLMATGDYPAACAKFAASQKLDAGVGTSLNLADCYEKSGRIASAWVEFRGAISAARSVGSKDREQLARDRAQALEAKLSYLTITTSPEQRGSIQITRDGTPVELAVLGTPIPIDPGKHAIEATAPGKKKWSETIDVGAPKSQIAVTIPVLASEAAAAPVPSETAKPAVADASKHGGAQRAVGVGVAVVGVIGVTAGTILGLKAKSSWSDAKSHCANYPYGCGSEGVSLGEDAKSAGNISTVAFLIGGAGLVGGAVLYFTASKDAGQEKSVSLGVLPGAVVVGGRF